MSEESGHSVRLKIGSWLTAEAQGWGLMVLVIVSVALVSGLVFSEEIAEFVRNLPNSQR